MILTSNRAPTDRYGLFPNPVVAEGVLDRLVNCAHHMLIDGRSYRPNKRPGARPALTTDSPKRSRHRLEPDRPAGVSDATNSPLMKTANVHNCRTVRRLRQHALRQTLIRTVHQARPQQTPRGGLYPLPRPALPGRTVGRRDRVCPRCSAGCGSVWQLTPAFRTAGAPGQVRNHGGQLPQCRVPRTSGFRSAEGAMPQRLATEACGHAKPRTRPAADASLDCGGAYVANAAVPTLDSQPPVSTTTAHVRPGMGSQGAVVAGGRRPAVPPSPASHRPSPARHRGHAQHGPRSDPAAPRSPRSHDAACLYDSDNGWP
jgi:hypothetical protein